MSGATLERLSPAALRARLDGGDELALLDVREEGAFAAGHLLLASSLPLSRLELRLRDLVPRRATPIVLCDRRGELVDRTAVRLRACGYHRLAALDGGAEAWAAAGFELFSGVNVPSKAFGELVEEHRHTPSISAAELQGLRDAGRPVLVLDSRPMDEFQVMSIPGAIDCPGAELVYRITDLAPAPDALVVVNCAGRTRSIIGAQSLIDAGIPNRVAALRNGTMGWELAGLALEHGSRRSAPAVSPEGVARARAMAEAVARRVGVRRIDRATLGRWQAASERTLYLFDVRSPEEYAAGHLPGALPAPGGQLVQKTDAFVGTRNARIVLVDDTGVRATMTASWLIQMGVGEVFVLADGIAGATLAAGPHQPEVPGLDAPVDAIGPAELARLQARGGAVVIDLATSLEHRAGHVPGAWFAIRAQLDEALARLPPAEILVLTSPDGVLARLAAPELAALAGAGVRVLAGGTAAWRAAGHPLETGLVRLASPADDVYWRPYDRQDGVATAMADYLAWEQGLVAQIARDGTARFRLASFS